MVTVESVQEALLRGRGITESNAGIFLQPTYETAIGNPFDFVDMRLAVELVQAAITDNKHILIWGDYDADGVSGTAVLVEVLRMCGANVTPYLPDRDQGYGLNRKALEQMVDTFHLLIAVDCGGSNVDEIAWLRDQGKQVIVMDHHELPDKLPPANAIIHPRHPRGHYSATHLAGAGVAWKFAQALLRTREADDDAEKWLLDLPLLGTLADSMPLVGENRAIVQFGMQVLQRTRRPGLKALIEASGLTQGAITAEDIAFRIIPPLNAAGRMEHPQDALDVVLARTKAEGEVAAKKLLKHNRDRRTLTQKIMIEAGEQYDPASPLVFAFNETWRAGVVGLVAGRLAEQYQKPAVVIGGSGEMAVGSARAYGDIDLFAALNEAREHTVKLGGHKQAAGFSLLSQNIPEFQRSLIQVLTKTLDNKEQKFIHTADAIVTPNVLSWDLQRFLEKLAPFGEKNPEPRFIIKDMVAARIKPVGKEGKHIKATLMSEGATLEGIGFGLGESLEVKEGQDVDALASLSVNRFRGNVSLQLQIRDIAASGSVTIS